MHKSLSSHLLLPAGILSLCFQYAQSAYILADDYSGEEFFKSFSFFTDADPTNGHVKYQSMGQANATGLAGFMDGGNATKAVYMGVDTTSETPQGRSSVRVQSMKSYQHALVIADIVHMPGSVCGTWPAFWMVGEDWPNNGEIDIVEGVNDQTSNQMTLHTSVGASISKSSHGTQPGREPSNGKTPSQQSRLFTGKVLTSNCDVNAPDQSKNAGCAIADNTSLTFGADFNTNGGGVYATEWTSSFIKIWFFPRGSFPSDIASASPSPSENWGPPTSMFTGDFDMDQYFKNLSIVFDTTFCGDWAGNTWKQSSCASLAPTCEEYVSKNPAAFIEAYWAVNTLQVFQDDGKLGRGAGGNGTEARPGGPPKAAGAAGTAALANGSFIKSAAIAHSEKSDFQPRRRSGGAVLGR
ncbi:hypothetical protein LTS08_004609 [Lithohypha guttulata]|nr:hypothetical protein LTS08_004609 [Lithohypha guttulata]